MLYLVNPDGSKLTELIRDSAQHLRISGPVAWSPDGSALALVRISTRLDGAPPVLSLIRSNGSGEDRIARLDMDETIGTITNVEWSPDGERILNQSQGETCIYVG